MRVNAVCLQQFYQFIQLVRTCISTRRDQSGVRSYILLQCHRYTVSPLCSLLETANRPDALYRKNDDCYQVSLLTLAEAKQTSSCRWRGENGKIYTIYTRYIHIYKQCCALRLNFNRVLGAPAPTGCCGRLT